MASANKYSRNSLQNAFVAGNVGHLFNEITCRTKYAFSSEIFLYQNQYQPISFKHPPTHIHTYTYTVGKIFI